MQKHVVIRNKMKLTRVLMDDPYLSQYVPDTAWFSEKALARKLKKHKVIYIKPNDGLKGQGIIRVKTLPQKKYEISYGKKVKKLHYDEMLHKVKKMMGDPENYLIQQGIKLATYNKRPFDIRLLLIKHLDRWHLTMITAKVAANKEAVVTNVSFNKKLKPTSELEYPISHTLLEYDQKTKPLAILRELIDVSYQTANKLGRHFPFYILGLDLAIDKKGNIWFVEANTSPAMKPMKKTNETKWYKRVKEATKHIEIIE